METASLMDSFVFFTAFLTAFTSRVVNFTGKFSQQGFTGSQELVNMVNTQQVMACCKVKVDSKSL